MKALGNVNAKTTITEQYKAALLRIIQKFETIFKLFKNVTQHFSPLDDIINYGLSYDAWKLTKNVKRK